MRRMCVLADDQFVPSDDESEEVEEVMPAKKTRAPPKTSAKASASKASGGTAKKGTKASTSTQSQLNFSRAGRGKTSNPIELSDDE